MRIRPLSREPLAGARNYGFVSINPGHTFHGRSAPRTLGPSFSMPGGDNRRNGKRGIHMLHSAPRGADLQARAVRRFAYPPGSAV
jgi:hypothetical protein